MRLLIADDSEVIRTTLAAMVKKWGYDAVVAADGSEAWTALQRPGAPRLAVLDWSMPDPDGVELCRRLRNSESAEYVYVLLLTARNGMADLVFAMDNGVDDFIAKPFDPQELRARLRAGSRIVELQQKLLRLRLKQVEIASSERALVGQSDFAISPRTEERSGGATDAPPLGGHRSQFSESLHQLAGGDEELMAALVAEFKADTLARLKRLRGGSADDPSALKSELCAIRENAARVGAEALAQACHLVEGAVAAGQAASDDFKCLQAVFEKTIRVLSAPPS
jgi:CheY-like chemotaxis protein/HPt (histidine-containing phosphotransfer) domain-containing protein